VVVVPSIADSLMKQLNPTVSIIAVALILTRCLHHKVARSVKWLFQIISP